MHTAVTLAVVISTCFLQNSLCERQRENKEAEGLKPGSATEMYGYKAISGDVFVMQCAKPFSTGLCGRLYNKSAGPEKSNWMRSDEETSSDRNQFIDDVAVKRCGNALCFLNVSAEHSGTYTCMTGGAMIRFSLEVLEKGSLGCGIKEKSGKTLVLGQGGQIHCPGVNCGNDSVVRGQNVSWYKNATPICAIKSRDIRVVDQQILHLGNVYENDSEDYFCDYTYSQGNGIHWTVRKHVKVSVISRDTDVPPRMIYPHSKETEEVELDQPHTLECRVQFGFQKTFDPIVEWRVSYHSNPEGTMEPMKMGQLQVNSRTIQEITLVRTAHISVVKLIHLDSTFTCLANNSVGNSNATVRLKRKPKASLTLVIACPLVSLLFLASLCITIHIYWLEITILYRVYRPFRETLTGKEFDAFVSYVPCPPSSEEVGGVHVTKEPLEVLLPRILEEKWGYRLCLLERDLLPGGAYAADVVWAIHSSRLLVCLMSPDYMSSTCLFELETGIRAMQQDACLRIILIWTNTGPVPATRTSLGTHLTAAKPSTNTTLSVPLSPGPPADTMPPVVRRAIRVLPALYWNPQDQGRMVTSSNSGSRFWRSLRKTLPMTPRGVSSGC
ncbi:hypothetical protein DPEC_G00151030 [Dallia pectoralis]|uniref:Uncharacterized protein n=1 Tax=Dallia pectoralis TaxID=75939 RepID=A0ACC2GJ70_DALPE|nr:hypothetical protein DPEC_G00151030 [Dallia pectoralis]